MLNSARVVEEHLKYMIDQGTQVQIDCDQPVATILQFIEHLTVKLATTSRATIWSTKLIWVDQDPSFSFFLHMFIFSGIVTLQVSMIPIQL